MSRVAEALRRVTSRNEGEVAHPSTTSVTSEEPTFNAGEATFTAPWSFAGDDSATTEAGAAPTTVEATSPAPSNVVAPHPPASLPALPSSTWTERPVVDRLLECEEPFVFRGFNPEWTDRLATSASANTLLVEQFRRLAAQLHQAQAVTPLKRVMVTSASAGDGKTLTAVNLALIFSESYGRNVLLIDADMRRPSIQKVSQIGQTVGLSEGLDSGQDVKLSVIRLTKNLTLLPAGRPVGDPMRGLTSPRMLRILEEAKERFDWVIVDAPPIGPVADAALLSAMVDTALFVVRAGKTPHALAQKAIEGLGRDRIFGVVLNAVAELNLRGYSPYYGVREEAAL